MIGGGCRIQVCVLRSNFRKINIDACYLFCFHETRNKTLLEKNRSKSSFSGYTNDVVTVFDESEDESLAEVLKKYNNTSFLHFIGHYKGDKIQEKGGYIHTLQ